MADPTQAELVAQAKKCPLVRGAYATGDGAVIRKTLAMHPPSRCAHAKEDGAK